MSVLRALLLLLLLCGFLAEPAQAVPCAEAAQPGLCQCCAGDHSCCGLSQTGNHSEALPPDRTASIADTLFVAPASWSFTLRRPTELSHFRLTSISGPRHTPPLVARTCVRIL